MDKTERCTCEQCRKMKNPHPVHAETNVQEGFTCHFRIVRDGRTQNYAAAMMVEVGDGRMVQSGSEFKLAPGTKQAQAISEIIHTAVDAGVLDELLTEATYLLTQKPQPGPGPRTVNPAVQEGTAFMLAFIEKALMAGKDPLKAMAERLEEVERKDPFRPIAPPKDKPYLN